MEGTVTFLHNHSFFKFILWHVGWYTPLKLRVLAQMIEFISSWVTHSLLHWGGGGSKLGPLGTSAIYWPTVPAPGDCEDGEFGGMNGRGNQSTRRKPAPAPLCPPQIPLDQTRDWTAAVGSQRLTASAMAQPTHSLLITLSIFKYYT
jgi:hypothetical protein